MSEFRVLIAGSGLGGLTLAQSLREQGIEVAVFERDNSPWERPQGYRLHFDADARNAAREVLPADRYAEFQAASYVTDPVTAILATDLTVRTRLSTSDELDDRVWPGPGAVTGHANVDRATVRRILLAGLEDTLTFGRPLERYEEDDHGVRAYLGDGTVERGDVLVGADGIHSAVRRQRAPGNDPVDAGITAIYGRIPLPAAASVAPPQALTDIFAIASDARKVFLGLGAVRFPASSAATAIAASRGQEDYVVCIVGGRHEFLPLRTDDGRRHTGDELRRIAAQTLAAWPTGAGAIIEAADPASFFPVRMRTSMPFTLDPPSRVTLLGDAAHAMTPTLGRGANLAMRDGALLGRALKAVARGHTDLGSALAAYEHAMLTHGFAVVTEAAHTGTQRMAQNSLSTSAPISSS